MTTETTDQPPAGIGSDALLAGVRVLLWRKIRFKGQTREDVDAVKEITLPYLVPGIKVFVDEDQDPDEPLYLFWSCGDRPCLVAAFREIIDKADQQPTTDEYLDYIIGESKGWTRVKSFWDVYRYSSR